VTDEDEQPQRMTVDEIAVLREVARWRRNHDVAFFQWRPGVGFGPFTEWRAWLNDDAAGQRRRVSVVYTPTDSVVEVVRHNGKEGFQLIPCRTVTEAVDMIVALGLLPPRFSSAYLKGWQMLLTFSTLSEHFATGEERERAFGQAIPAWPVPW
jgi:hypothetical protein